VVHGFYEQTNIQTLNDANTIEQEMLNCHPDLDRQQARNICGAMLFEGDDALKKISVLSGGEKARVMLGKILATPVNLLLLDEPTNHLDMESCDALVAAIDNFDGAVIMVTHNEMFLHALAQRLIVFDQDRASVFEGTYQEFLERGGWGDESAAPTAALAANQMSQALKTAGPQLSKKELRQQRSAIISERSRVLKPVEQAIAKAEATIETQEKRLAQLNEEMIQASQAQDGSQIAKLSPAISQCSSIIDKCFEELEGLYARKESMEQTFNTQLEELGEG
jgi:ATP-binding cassette subfamily F protein 3